MGYVNHSFALEGGKVGFESRVGEVGVVKFTTPASRYWIEGKIVVGSHVKNKDVQFVSAPAMAAINPEYIPGPIGYPGSPHAPAAAAPPHVHVGGDSAHIAAGTDSKGKPIKVTNSIRHIWLSEDSNGQTAVPGTEQYAVNATYVLGKGTGEIELTPNTEYYVCIDYRNKDTTFTGPKNALGETGVEVIFKNV